jgi:lactate dehydrogenase-like 2-hydroxyacid dehydrogenase
MHHLVNAQVLQALGPEGDLVNVACGTVVDEAALLAALRTGGISAAALAVIEDEPLQDSALVSLPNVLLSAHTGSGTKETRAQLLRLTLNNLDAVLCGRPTPRVCPIAQFVGNSYI